jgi:hypothetical protein
MKSLYLFIIILSVMAFIGPITLNADVNISIGAKIQVFWRFVPADLNPMDIKAKFDSHGTITAAKSPFGGGGITGKQIVSLIKKNTTRKTIIRFRALSLKNGEDPSAKPSLSSIVVRDNNSLYDNYVIKTKNNDLAIYVDVLVVK